MQHVLDTGKRAISAAVAAATIAFSIGAGALLSPAVTHAAAAGDRIRSQSLSTVYYYGYDGMRYTYPNVKTYTTWHSTTSGQPDFSGVMTVSDSTISDITLGGNIVVRPGASWIKVTSDPKTYAVGRNGKIYWIESEAVAVAYAGSDWNQRIIDVPDVFFTDYTVGASLMTATAYNGMMYMSGGNTYLSWDGAKRLVSSAGMTANGLQSRYVMDGSGIVDSALVAGSDLTTREIEIVDDAQTEEGTVVSTGALTVSAASSMPAGASLPGGANSVPVFSFNVKAGSAAASFDGVTLSMIGAGATTNIANAYLYEGNTRLTESRTVNSSTRQVSFNNLNRAIAANSTHTYTVRVTVSTSQTAADTFGFKIANAADVVSAGSVGGSFPITGNIFTLTGSDSGTLTITKTGTIADPTIGEQDAEIAEFKATASGSEAADITAITVKVDNASDHADFRLWDGNVLLATGVNSSGDWVVFDLSADPFHIEEGGNNIFTVSADIGGQAADTIKAYIDNSVDVVAIGGDFGFGLTVDTDDSNGYDGSSCTSSSGKCSFSTIKGGDLTFAFNGPAAGDIQTDAQDQTLLNFSITASQFITIKDLDVLVYGDDAAALDGDAFDDGESGNDDDDEGLINGDDDGVADSSDQASLTDIKIINADTGAVLMGPMELDSAAVGGNDAVQTIDFTDDFSLDAGETLNLRVTADVDNEAATGTAFGAEIDMSALVTEDENGDALAAADIVPGSDIRGYSQVARSASLVIALASTPSSTTTVDGSQNVSVVGFTVTAGLASPVTVTDLTITAYGDDDGTPAYTIGGAAAGESDVNDNVESCSLYDGATRVAGPEAPASNGQTFRFDSINWTLSAGAVKLLTVQCNFANTSTSGDVYFGFDINDVTTDIVAEDADGDTISVTATSDVNGATSPTRVVTVSDSGTLAVTVGSNTPSADFVLTSTNNAEVAQYHFVAGLESFNITTLEFVEFQASVDTGSADSAAYANNISLVTISYPKADGTTGTATASMSGNAARFNGLSMYVPVGSPKDVKVYVNTPLTDRDSGGSATSNEKIRMTFSDGDNTGSESFKATGAGSGFTLDEAGTGIADLTSGVPAFVVRETKPVITLSSSSPSGSAVVGRSEVFSFNVAASANEDVVLSEIIFKLNTTANATAWNTCDTANAGRIDENDFDLYNYTMDGTSQTLEASDAEWSILSETGVTMTCPAVSALIASFAKLTLATPEVISKGTSNTFKLYFDSTGASSLQDDSLRVDLAVDPILGTLIALGTGRTVSGAHTITATTLTASGALDTTGTSAVSAGDILAFAGSERVLVTAYTPGAATATIYRGYLGTTPVALSGGEAITRLPSSLLWQDDGSVGVTSAATSLQEYWGSYLVDNLTVNGGTLVF